MSISDVAGVLGIGIAGTAGILANAGDPTEWKNPAGGNMIISQSAENINWGNIKPSDLVGELRKVCHAVGCESDPSLDTHVVRDKKRYSEKVTMSIESASFPSKGHGSKDQMMDVLEKYLMTDKVFEMQRLHWRAPDGCPNNASPFCNTPEGDEDQWFAPKAIEVRFENDGDGDLTSVLNVRITVEAPEKDALCGEIVGKAGEIAGMVEGIPDAGFALGELLCGLFGGA